jgi:glycosyltransferase 2 family protein
MAGVPRHRVLNALRIVLALLVTAAVGVAVARNWAEVSADIRKISPEALLLAAGLVSLAPVLTMLGWRRILADLGSPLHVAPAGGIFFVGQLGKYLPGSVWSIVAQAEMGTRLHIPRRRSAVVGLIGLGIAVICGVAVGLPALPLLLGRDDTRALVWAVLLAVPLFAVLLWPPLLNWGIALGLRLLHREPLEHSLSGRAVLTTVVLFVGAWLASGAHAWVLATAIGESQVSPGRLALLTVCGFALSSSLAMFTFVLPAGVGVREGLLVLLLAPATSPSAATAVVVISRFLTVVSDVVFAGAGWLWAKSHHLLTSRAEREHDGVVVDEDAEAESASGHSPSGG